MKPLHSFGVLAAITSIFVPVHAEVFIPAGTVMESNNPGAPTFGVTGQRLLTAAVEWLPLYSRDILF